MRLKQMVISRFRKKKNATEKPLKYEFGLPVPLPMEMKHNIIIEYSSKFNISILIETGTFLGNTIDVCIPFFSRIQSIEVDKVLASKAKNKYASTPKVTIIEGDSGIELENLLKDLKEPAIFWLDGHYSGGYTGKGEKNTPILRELNAILNHSIKNHLILIDDARCFIGEFDYPTLFEIYEIVKKVDPAYKINVKDDIIRIGYEI